MHKTETNAGEGLRAPKGRGRQGRDKLELGAHTHTLLHTKPPTRPSAVQHREPPQALTACTGRGRGSARTADPRRAPGTTLSRPHFRKMSGLEQQVERRGRYSDETPFMRLHFP